MTVRVVSPLDLPEAGKKLADEAQSGPTPQQIAEADAQIVGWPKLAGKKAPPREWAWDQWAPRRAVTLLHGFGGVGKTLLAQQIGTAAAFSREMLGAVVDACPVLAWFGEDDHDEIWRRQECINAALGLSRIETLENRVFWRTCPQDDITLFEGSFESSYRTTDNFEILRHQLKTTAAKLLILDSATQIAAVPEANRPLVTRCIQVLTKLCYEFETTIILLSHNNRTGDYSGSSAWENRCRSRIHMKREEENGADTTKLLRPKANYAELENGVKIEWHKGAYRCTDPRFETQTERLERKLKEGAIDQAFLDALDRLTQQQRAVSDSKNAGSYAPKVIAEANLAEYTKDQLEQAMNRLFAAERIVAKAVLPWTRDRDRHQARGIARKVAG